MQYFSKSKFHLTAMSVFLFMIQAHASDLIRVKTDRGKVQGKMGADGQVRVFLGIPYASPPVGLRRWKPPQPDMKWHGVLQASSFGPRCIQPANHAADMIFRDPKQSEDCLTLNVWTPTRDRHAKLPVMVWIYGGGFTSGSTSEQRQDGERLARKGVLIVSMNYRLGIFGFFASHELSLESTRHAAGNYGLMDQTAALRWVQRNIAAFGGDPNNVTLFGESAGSISVSAQMASPLSQGLFGRAIGESGGAFPNLSFYLPPLAVSEQQDEDFAQTAFGSSSLASLRAISADDLQTAVTSQVHFWPVIDGDFLPEDLSAIYAQGKQAHVPLLAGWNQDEGTVQVLRAVEKPTVERMKEMAQKQFGSRAGEFLHVYSASSDAEAVRVAEDFAGDRFIAYSTWAWLDAQVKTGKAPVFRYRFDLGSPGDANHPASVGAFHADDIEYVFGTLDSRKGAVWRPEDYKLAELVQNYWTNFAKTGNPNGHGVPHWPTYNAADNWEVMHLASVSKAQPDQHRDRYLFLQDVGRELLVR
jgi:para-nitrobenzyl esterase